MHICSPHKTGLIGAGLLGGWHLIWALMVAVGIAQPLMDWILSLHMINLSYGINEFNIVSALLLVAVTAISGYAIGYLIGYLFSCCRGCMGGSCCMEGDCSDEDCMMPEHGHMTLMMPPTKSVKKKSPAKKKVAKKPAAKKKVAKKKK